MRRDQISPSVAIELFYQRIVIANGISFAITKPLSGASLSRDELDRELTKGIASLKRDKLYTVEEADAYFDE